MGRYRVLLIDDEESLKRAISNYFQKLGHDVFTAASGEEGVALFDRCKPDVAIVDLYMPGMSGMDVLHQLRRRGGTVLMLTGYGEVESAVEAMRLGAENFLTKPIEMSHLMIAVEKAAEKHRLRHENVELRRRLAPSIRKKLARAAAFVVLISAAGGLGAVIGSGPKGDVRPRRPIPVPLKTPDTTVTRPDAPLLPGITNSSRKP